MRLVHLSDLHLGFRQFSRQTPDGVNQREADVAATCARAIDQIIALAPDLVLVGGDVFHHVRPANSAILDGFRLFARLRAQLPDTAIIMIAGNHDVPRSADSGCILQLFRELDVDVVFRGMEHIDDARHDLSVVAVPYDTAADRAEALVPPIDAPRRRFNVLLAHDEVRGVLPHAAPSAGRQYEPVDPLALAHEPWDYVALGHYHVYRRIALTHEASGRVIPCYYSGSIDYTSSNPWFDLREEAAATATAPRAGKGFIEHDLATGQHVFHPVAPTRPLLDLPSIDALDLTASALDARIADTVEAAGDDVNHAIVRLVVHNVSRHVVRTLDYVPLRELRRRALHFHLDARPPVAHDARPEATVAGRRATLRDRLADRLQERALAPGLDRERLVQLGLTYLARAEDATVAALPVDEG